MTIARGRCRQIHPGVACQSTSPTDGLMEAEFGSQRPDPGWGLSDCVPDPG